MRRHDPCGTIYASPKSRLPSFRIVPIERLYGLAFFENRTLVAESSCQTFLLLS